MNEEMKAVLLDEEGKEQTFTVTFVEGCFDGLIEDDITEEEMEEIKKEIMDAIQRGDFFDNAMPVELDDDEIDELLGSINTRH